MVTELEMSFREGNVKSILHKKQMTSGTFQSLVGFKDEVRLLEVLTQLNDGEISLGELRQLGKEMKGEQKQEISGRDQEVQRLRQENARLLRENNRLGEMLRLLQPKETHDKSTSTVEYKVGETVDAMWEDGHWYLAVIKKISDDGYTVRFRLDTVVSVVTEDQIRKRT